VDLAGRGLTPLLETVADEAQRAAEALGSEARRRAELRVAEAERSAQEIEAQASASGAAEGEREAQRRIALARIETRLDLLLLRESEIDRAIELAKRRLAELTAGAEGARLVAGAIRAAARVLGESHVRVRASERAALEAALAGGELAIEWEPAERDEPGALVLALDGRRVVDMTLGGILRRRHDRARQVAAETLFGKRSAP